MPSYIIIQQAKYPLGNGFHPFFKKFTYPFLNTIIHYPHFFFLFSLHLFLFVMKYVIIYHVTLDHMGHEKSMTMQHLNILKGQAQSTHLALNGLYNPTILNACGLASTIQWYLIRTLIIMPIMLQPLQICEQAYHHKNIVLDTQPRITSMYQLHMCKECRTASRMMTQIFFTRVRFAPRVRKDIFILSNPILIWWLK